MSDTPRTKEEIRRISSQCIGDNDDFEYAMDQLGAHARELERELARRTAERNEVQLKWQRLYGEIDCRIEHGADSNSHLEAIRKMMQKIETNIKETDND
jgi:hypothetical protein